MKLILPFTPHLAFECLEMLKCESVNKWPNIDKENIIDEIKLAVQINGKTRDVITKRNLKEKEIEEFILKNSKAKKYLRQKLLKLFSLKIKL